MGKSKKNDIKKLRSEMDKIYNQLPADVKAHAECAGELWAEYRNQKAKLKAIDKLIVRQMSHDALGKPPVCATPIDVLYMHRDIIISYIDVLKLRAEIEDIPL